MSSMPGTDSISGTLTQANVTPAAGTSTIAGVAQAIEAGDACVNIHTAAYPLGELRGQLAVASTPEPATGGLLLVSLAGGAAFLLIRRRTQPS
ncbi:MAG: CHRD domain-containing protein [Acidobacteriota bacterium]|nr:CHRD domain-containing protein [Acidobacteriota bacterium]